MMLSLPCLLPSHKALFFLPTDKPPVFGACKRLDIELEMVRQAICLAIVIEKY